MPQKLSDAVIEPRMIEWRNLKALHQKVWWLELPNTLMVLPKMPNAG